MPGLASIVQEAKDAARRELDVGLKHPHDSDEHVPIAVEHDGDIPSPSKRTESQDQVDSAALVPPLRRGHGSISLSGILPIRSPDLDTPSARTGPPRSLSFAYSFPQSPALRSSGYQQGDEDCGINTVPLTPAELSDYYADRDEEANFSNSPTPEFRTPLEHPQRESSHSSSGKDHHKGKRRSTEDFWLAKGLRWFQDSPREDGPPSNTTDSYFGHPQQPLPHDASIPNSVLSPTLTDEPEQEHRQAEDSNDEPQTDASPERHGIKYSNGKSEQLAPLPAKRRNASGTSQFGPDIKAPLVELELKSSPSHHRAISVPSSPKTPNNKKLGRRWSFTSLNKTSAAGPVSQRQLSVDGSSGKDGSATGGRAKARWNKLRSMLTSHLQTDGEAPLTPAPMVVSPSVNIIDELITGGLATLMPKLWLERDDKGHRRVPALLHRLRLRITDSLHPLHKSKSVFRIECEYANGAARWVVYRELKDFVSLHGHYAVANAANKLGNIRGKSGEKLPEFPATSLPYFKFLNKEGGMKISKADFARMQRELLEDYLIDLIRAVMFHPSSNRLSAFLEISALSIALAQSGGAQIKAGYLRVEATAMALAAGGGRSGTTASSNNTGFGRKSTGWRERKEPRWFAVRESYLVAMEEPGELTVWDVFLLDSDFTIERPKRYYRQGLGLLHYEHHDDDSENPNANKANLDPQRVLPSGRSTSHHRRSSSGQTRTTTTTGTTDSANIRHRLVDGTSSTAASRLHTSAGGSHARVKLDTPFDDNKSMVSSIRSKVSRIFNWDGMSGRKRSMSSSQRPSTSSRKVPNNVNDDDSDSSGDESSISHGLNTPMVDPSITTNPILTVVISDEKKANGATNKSQPSAPADNAGFNSESTTKDNFKATTVPVKRPTRAEEKDVSRHTFYIVNSQMRLKLYARSERQMLQFIAALERTAHTTPYTRQNRFDSFAPIRMNVAAQWLVDGRDYFWNLSRAILLAKECIYIHDWWLSPELLMRRPGVERYRLDRLLERKAKEGVKIYIVLYLEVSNRTTPIDSNYTKQRLTSLHPNIMVQRSPSHFQTGTFYWAHHEKMCVIDQAIAFMGGLDLCFGRWDTPQHVLTDDTMDTDNPEIWPGKDYSNPRVGDFYTLNKPEDDMYDRTKVHRMPWHDVSLQIVGQPARDLARHFVQRWNYLLRIKNHSRMMPFLLPPPEFRPGELHQMGLTGTCELQICRSAGPWSLGTPGKTEQSVQNAYLKAIQMSEHFVYIENQFFITSTTIGDVKIENKIGDALIQRIIRAHKDQKPWKCCVMLPLLPGFTFPVDHSDASAIRIILECQNRTIARGSDSIFSRLRRENIDPDEYISFFSLRNWGKMRGDVLTTEQVYIHAKICIVDDRLAIIGSANINERSLRGDRDSELAAVIRDTDLMDGTMAGQPFQVGRFAHTLRMRLMQEHLGVDVDAVQEEDLMANEPTKPEDEQVPWDPEHEQACSKDTNVTHVKPSKSAKTPASGVVHFGASSAAKAAQGSAEAVSLQAHRGLKSAGLSDENTKMSDSAEFVEAEQKDYTSGGEKRTGFASSAIPTLEEKTLLEGRPRGESISRRYNVHPILQETIEEEGQQDIDELQNESDHDSSKTSEDFVVLDNPPQGRSHSRLEGSGPRASFDDDQRTIPDVRGTLKRNASLKSSNWGVPTNRPKISFNDFEDPICDAFWKDKWVASSVHNTEIYRKVFHAVPDDLVTTWKQYREFILHHERMNRPVFDPNGGEHIGRVPSDSEEGSGQEANGDGVSDCSREDEMHQEPQREIPSSAATTESFKRTKPARGTEAFDRWERDQMEKLLGELNGHLVIYPTRFLEGEDIANNFLFNADRMLPLPIYN